MYDLKPKHLRKLFRVFKACDKDRSGSMDTDEFYKLIHENPSIFGDSIFELIDVNNNGSLDFGEFCEAVATYCMFGKEDILKFCFYIFDKDKNGFISPDELQDLVGLLHSYSLSNITQVMKELSGAKGDARISFSRFKAMNDAYPFVLFPAFRIQDTLQRISLGAKFWDHTKKINKIVRDEIAEDERHEKLTAGKEKERQLLTLKKAKLRKKNGCFTYYCCFYCYIAPRLAYVEIDDVPWSRKYDNTDAASIRSRRHRHKHRKQKSQPREPKTIAEKENAILMKQAGRDRQRGRQRIGKRQKDVGTEKKKKMAWGCASDGTAAQSRGRSARNRKIGCRDQHNTTKVSPFPRRRDRHRHQDDCSKETECEV